MKHYLDHLLHTPGVRAAGFVAPDGVSLAWSERAPRAGEERLDIDGLGALASSWHAEISRSAAPLSWSAPVRAVLRASRGTLILAQAPQLLLVVLLDGGMSHEDLRLPMDAAIARLTRHLKNIEQGQSRENGALLPHKSNTPTPTALSAPLALEITTEERKASQSASSGE